VAELLEALLRLCAQGDEQAVAELVGRFSPSAMSLAEAILADGALAEDAVQNAFLAALRRLGQLREPQAFPAWFQQIVRTEAGRIIRGRRDGPAFPQEPASPTRDGPEDEAMKAELRSVVRAALGRLSDAQRTAAELFYLDERSIAEVAHALRVPAGTVKRRLHDARRQLRSMLLGYIAEEEPPRPAAPRRWDLPL
jgi:RNA polymerase sigma factor (sigma-70 family)